MKCRKRTKTGALRRKKKNSEWLVWNRPCGDGWYTTHVRETLIHNDIIQVYVESVRVFCSHCALRSHVGEPAKKKKTKNSGAEPVFL